MNAPSRKSADVAAASDEVDAREAEARITGEAREPSFLQRDVVVGIEVVDTRHRDSVGEQSRGDVHPDEAGGAGDQHVPLRLHRRASASSARSFAYLMKLFWQPIAMWTSPATPSRKPSFTT